MFARTRANTLNSTTAYALLPYAIKHIVHGLHREQASLLPNILNIYEFFYKHPRASKKKTLLHIHTCACNHRTGFFAQPSHFLLQFLHYKIAHSSFIFYSIFNSIMFSYVKKHSLQVLLNK